MEAAAEDKVCSVGWWAGDPEELIVQIKSEGSLLQIGKIKLVVGSSMVVFNLREGENTEKQQAKNKKRKLGLN